MARYNAGAKTLIVNQATTFTYAFTGGLITLTGSSGYNVGLVNPTYCPGLVQNFFNATSGSLTISTASGTIKGPALTADTTQTIPTGAVFSLTSDGTNYVLTNDHGGPLLATTAQVNDTLTVSTSTTSPVVQGSTTSAGTLTIKSTGSGSKATAGVLMTDGIASTTTTTGTLVVTGGVGVSENIRAGGTIYGNLSSSNVALDTTGTINGISIGASSRSTGAFTTLGANGAVTIQTTTNNQSYTTTGAGTIGISSGTTGTMDNIAIGNSTRSTGKFTTLDANSSVTLSPSGVGVTISPTGAGNVVISPATAGTIDNMAIGNTTRGAGSFTTLNSNNTVNLTAGGTATNSTTGTLRVTGGAGFTGAIYADGNVTYNRSERVETSTSYYLVAGDVGQHIYMNNSGSGTVYVPNDSRSTIPTGAIIWIYKGNAALTLAAEGGVTVSATGSFNLTEELYVRKRGSNNWVVGHAPTGGSLNITGGSASTISGYKIQSFTGGSATATIA